MTIVLFPIRAPYLRLVARTVLDRIRELWRARGFDSEAAFLKACGLSPGYLANLEDRIKARTKAGKDPTKVTINLDAAVRMARVLGLHAEQLATDEYVAGLREDPYPERYWAIEAARIVGLPEPAIRAVSNERPESDLSRQAWLKRIEAAAFAIPERAPVVPLQRKPAERS